ncbi:Hypothetical protein GLP15_4585 [Giardia lamblia P15]|uniref:Structural maintenance of chromosomes protein 5 n=1 Tax=Giardia intestinalis (strain P15) TaxID=658858 RepID=E1F120_GIAIA|nr:Hypothetical protein GLP15_4585 [Giardia lamblia P15]
MEQPSFSSGQIIGIECYHFRGVGHARVYALPTVNYFVAPNGFGKTTLLYAVALCLGSRHPDFCDTDSLIQEHQLSSCALVSICNTSQLSVLDAHNLFTKVTDLFCQKTHNYILSRLTHASICTVHVVLKRGKHIQFYVNGRAVTQDKLCRDIRKNFEIQVDNPFQSMMQSDAQRLTLMTPSERLIKFLDLLFPDLTNTLKSLQPQAVSLMNFCRNTRETFETSYISKHDDFLKVVQNAMKIIEIGSLKQTVDLGRQALLVLEFLEVNTERTNTLHEYNKLVSNMKSKEEPLIALKRDIEKIQFEVQRITEEIEKKFTVMKSSIALLERTSRTIAANSKRLLDLQSTCEAVITQRQNQSDEDHLTLQQRINLLNDQIHEYEASISELEAKRSEASVALCNMNFEASSLYASTEYKNAMLKHQQIETEREQREQLVLQCRSLPHHSWLVDIYQVSLELELDSSMRYFLLVPVANWIGIKSDTPIPFNIVKFMLQSTLGQSLYTILTNSIEHQSNLSRRFDQYRDRGGATAIELLQDCLEMNYQDAYNHANQELENQYALLKTKTINTAGIKTLSASASSVQVSAMANIVFLIDCLDGNPIVLNHFFQKLSLAVYVQSSSGSKLTNSEIIRFMEFNIGTFNILCHDGMLHIGTSNSQKQLLARTSYGLDPTKVYAECVQGYTERLRHPRFIYKILEDKKAIEKELKELQDSYSDNIQASKSRMEELKLFMNQSRIKLTETNQLLRDCRSELNDLDARMKAYKVITEHDIFVAEKAYTDMSNLLSTSAISALVQSKARLADVQVLIPLATQVKDLYKRENDLNISLTSMQDEHQLAQKRVCVFRENTLSNIEDVFKVRKARILSILKVLCPDMVPDPPLESPYDSSLLETTFPYLLTHRAFTKELTKYVTSAKLQDSVMNLTSPYTVSLTYFKAFVNNMENRFKLQQSKQDQSIKNTFLIEKKRFCDFLSDRFASNTYIIVHFFRLLEVIRTVQSSVAEVIAEVSKRFQDNIKEFGISGEAVLTGLLISDRRRNPSIVSPEFEAAYTLLKEYHEDHQHCFEMDKFTTFLIENPSLKAVSISFINNTSEVDSYTTLVLNGRNTRDENNNSKNSESSTTASDNSSVDTYPAEPTTKKTVSYVQRKASEDGSTLMSKLIPFLEKLKQASYIDLDASDESSDSDTHHHKHDTQTNRTSDTSIDIFSRKYQKSKHILSAKVSLATFLTSEVQENQLIALSKAFKPIVKEPQIQAIIPLMASLKPGLELKTQFVANETLTGITLSGGESSVVALCLVNSLYGQKALSSIRFRLVDEINQGLDDKFEKVAHDMLCSLRNDQIQYFVGSPKLPSYLTFEDPRIRVHIIIRRPLLVGPSDFVNVAYEHSGDATLESLCTEELY